MEKALLEEHIRYGEARFRDKELVRPFVNRIYQDLAELEKAMKPKTCDGCRSKSCSVKRILLELGEINSSYFYCNDYEPKER